MAHVGRDGGMHVQVNGIAGWFGVQAHGVFSNIADAASVRHGEVSLFTRWLGRLEDKQSGNNLLVACDR